MHAAIAQSKHRFTHHVAETRNTGKYSLFAESNGEKGESVATPAIRNGDNSQRRYDFRPESVTARPEKNITDPRMLAMKKKLST